VSTNDTQAPLKTTLIGFGKIGAGYADDPVMARYYPYATHAQVLKKCSGFAWESVVDPAIAQLEIAKQRWGIDGAFHSIAELTKADRPQVAVIATPPDARLEIIEKLPDLRAILVEKPLGVTLDTGRVFLEQCHQKNILVQVNFWRRADETFGQLARGKLTELIGEVKFGFVVYGNGLRNNGTHAIDFTRMLFGEVVRVRANDAWQPDSQLPIAGDANVSFTIWLENGTSIDFRTVNFTHYREVAFDLWGDRGRLAIVNEGLNLLFYPRDTNRAVQNQWEILHDRPQSLNSTVGRALYRMYANLADAIANGTPLCSPGDSALQTEKVVEAVVRSSQENGILVEID